MLQVITFSHSEGMSVKRHADINVLHILKLNPHWKKRCSCMTFMTSMTKQTKHIVNIPPTTHTVFSHYSLSKHRS
jgi:hypothetical protein